MTLVGRFSVTRKPEISAIMSSDGKTLCPGGGGALPYISYIGMCRPIGEGFLSRFGLKTGMRFAHFGLESRMVFEGTTGVY